MLNGISPIIPPDLLKIMDEMGHGDEIVFGDGNYPSASFAKRLVRCDGRSVTELLEAILPLFPLDPMVKQAAFVMQTPEGTPTPPVWAEYRKVIEKFSDTEMGLEKDFYERSKKAYVIVQTGETALYANIILRKGIVKW